MRPRRCRFFRRSGARAEPAPARLAFRAPGPRPRPSAAAAAAASPAGAMAAAAGDGAVKPLQCAMKLANGAIELDTGNRPREAYTEYLRSVHYIAQVLLEEVEATKEAGDPVPPDTSKMLKLAEQCLERAQSTAAKLGPWLCMSYRENTPEAFHACGRPCPLSYQPTPPGVLRRGGEAVSIFAS